jgi:hypothetical protein
MDDANITDNQILHNHLISLLRVYKKTKVLSLGYRIEFPHRVFSIMDCTLKKDLSIRKINKLSVSANVFFYIFLFTIIRQMYIMHNILR